MPRAFYYDAVTAPGTTGTRGGLSDAQRSVMDDAIAALRAQGAEVVDPADIPSITSQDPGTNLTLWPTCSGPDNARGKDATCSIVFKYGMKRDFNQWLASLGPSAPVKTLTELRAWNTAHEKAGTLKYGQAQLDISDEMDVERDRVRYEADRAKDVALAGRDGIDAALQQHKLDALLFPGEHGRGNRRQARLSDGHRAVRHVAQYAHPTVARHVQRTAGTVWRELHGHGVQRAEVDRARLRVRASHEATRASAARLNGRATGSGPRASARSRAPEPGPEPGARSLESERVTPPAAG